MRSKASIPAKKIRNQKIKSMKKKEEPLPKARSTGKKWREKDLEDFNSLTDENEREDYFDES